MDGLLQALSDIESALNTMAAANGFPDVDLTPAHPSVAAKPGLYLAFTDETRPQPPDNKWIQPVGAMATFDAYMYFPVDPATPLVKTLVDKLALIKTAIQNLTQTSTTMRCFVSHVVPMYDWATRSWAGIMVTITADSYRNSSDG